MFKCIFCGHELIWGCDFDFEDFGMDGDGIVGTYTCSNHEKCGYIFELDLPLEDGCTYNEGVIRYFAPNE